jgi:fermentation-respiration switch protein FrsA (DUF1100 family)
MPSVPHTIRDDRLIRGGRRVTLELDARDERVPAILLLPTAARPAPAALLVHGFTSRKERMADTIGTALLEVGMASLALDLPLHGERESIQEQSLTKPLELIRRWQMANAEATLGLRYLAERSEVDGARLAVVGYSLGAFLGVTVAAREPAVRAVVLAAGGDLPAGTPFAALVRAFADPLRAVGKLAGRPLLMVHGRHDRTVRPEQAERLFAAAREPKTLRWWDAGHHLPPAAITDAAVWLAERMRDLRPEAVTASRPYQSQQ